MKINDNLDIILDIRQDEAGKATLRLFHTPIDRDVFELNYKLLSSVFSEIWGQGSFHAMSAGPRIASMVLKDVAKKQALSDSEDYDPQNNISTSFLNEIKRLTMILAPSASGWEKIPVQSAIARGVIDLEEWQEAESSLVFFTSAFHLARRSERESRMKILLGLLRGRLASSDSTDQIASSPISTGEGTSAPPKLSSVPY